jgi:acyl phosphate:glycerol-3-phosphate acyltransferase
MDMTLPFPDISYLVVLLAAYLLGAVPFGLIFTKLAGLGDIRAIGSGNIGATNVLRTGHKGLAAATLIADALKGTFAVWAAGFWGAEHALIAALGAFLGHLFPIWLRFKGGKGVATFLGCLIAVSPITALVFAIVWLVTAFISKYSSLAALLASALIPPLLWLLQLKLAALLFLIMMLLLWWKHYPNIMRLRAGTEGRIGQ